MKKTLKNISCFMMLAVALAGCSKSQLEDKYNDPDKTTNPSIEKLFSGMMDNNRVRPQYWDIRTIAFLNTGAYSQVSTSYNDGSVYQGNQSYQGQRWNDYYVPNNFTNNQGDVNSGSGPMAEYRTIMRLYNETPIESRLNVQVFTIAAKTLLLDQTSQMIDLFGDIPFTEAGSLDVSNTISNAAFQDQKALYDTVMIGLKDCADYFAGTSLNTNAAASFAVQDYALHGSLDKWRRYANSLRLRLLMRTSFVDEATAKAAVQEMFTTPLQYPLIDGGNIGDNYSPTNTDVMILQPTVYTDNLGNAFNELQTPLAAPDYMLNVAMKPANDPRIPFMFDKYGKSINGVFVPNATYRAMPADWGSSTQLDSLSYFATYDSTTFRFNSKLPGIMMTAAEVNFLRAEAVERWGITGPGSLSAAQYYELGVRQAVAFIYYLYNTNSNKYEALNQPSTSTVDAFMTQPTIAYTGTAQEKLEKIWVQKWLHFNILQATQAWSETRRTDYPKFSRVFVSSLPGFENAPNRFRYPPSETAYNTSYKDVQAKDTRDAKIFWDVLQP
jgi:hypothetical protein